MSDTVALPLPIAFDPAALPVESMRKERGHLPRLSVPYDPNKPRDARFWTEAEFQVLRDNYGKPRGVDACRRLLPNRSLTVIYQKAQQLGLRADGKRAERKRYTITPELEETIRERWPSLTARGATTAFAAELGLPKHIMLRAAERMGLTRQQRKEPPWTDAEKELLRKTPLHNLKRASDIFRAHGFNRTSTAINSMAKRQDVSRRYRETLSATSFAKILGVDNKSVAIWCQQGTLKATRREDSERLPQQGGAPWSITREDARQFVLDQLAWVDIRKVDKVAFVELLAGGPDPDELRDIVDALERVIDSVELSLRTIQHKRKEKR